MVSRQPRRLHWALLTSLVLHAVLVTWVVLRPKPPPVPVKSEAIELEWVRVEPLPLPAPVPDPARVAPEVVAPAVRKAKAASTKAAVEASAAAPATPEPVASAPSVPMGEQADSPRQKSAFLVPRVGTVMPGLGRDPDDSEAQGHTVRNGPGEEPDAVAVREYTAERAAKKINDQIGDMLGAAARRGGLVEPYFTKLQADLTQGFVGKDVKLSKRSTGQMLREEVLDTYTGPAERFAKTGNPLENDEQAREFSESGMGRMLQRGGPSGGDVNTQRLAEAGLQSMAFSKILKDSASRARLKTVLMLRQDGDGALAEATVIEKSGDTEFDEFVLHLSRKVVREQGDTSEVGGAPSALGWSSVWQFTWEPPEVKVKFLRVIKPRAPTLQ